MSHERSRAHHGHLVRLVRNRLGAHVCLSATAFPDGDTFAVERARLAELVAFLKRDPDADLSLLVDISAIDRTPRAPRFEVRWRMRSPRLGYRATFVVHVEEDDAVIPTLVPYWAGAESLERELHEMFGIYPDGHPHLRPLLLYPELVGHPLRRDYRATKQQPLVPLLQDEKPPVTIEEAP